MDYIKVFKQNEAISYPDKMIEGALECLDRFGTYFEREDVEGMDSCLHFPHYILSGNEIICWNEGGKLTAAFFENLKWRKSNENLRYFSGGLRLSGVSRRPDAGENDT